MITIEKRDKYDAVLIFKENEQVAKAYIHPDGKVSNLYIRKQSRGTEIIQELFSGIIENYKDLPLYGYASPKYDKSKRQALLRLYKRFGFINTKNAKVEYKP